MCFFVFMCNCVVCECERKGEKIDLEYLRECVSERVIKQTKSCASVCVRGVVIYLKI